jgi:hypothetical protein
MIRSSVLLLLFTLGLASCGSTSAQIAQPIDLGVEVTLAPGSTAVLKQGGIEVQFVAVTADSRCPRDVTCVWAGEVKVQLLIRSGSQPATQHEVLKGENAVAGKYRVTVVRVLPAPGSTSKILPGDYRATLQVERAADSKAPGK